MDRYTIELNRVEWHYNSYLGYWLSTAHIRGEPLPKPTESPSTTPLTDGSDTDQNSALTYSYVSNLSVRPNHGPVAPGFEVIDHDHSNIYDNVPEDRSALYARHYQTHAELRSELRSSSPEGVLRRGVSKRGTSKLSRSSPPDQDLYMNVEKLNREVARLMPPKKPQRNSIGILLDQAVNGNSPQMERKQDQPVSSSPMHLDVRGPHPRQSNTLSSQGENLERNAYTCLIIIIITFYLPRVATSVMKPLFQRALHNIICYYYPSPVLYAERLARRQKVPLL